MGMDLIATRREQFILVKARNKDSAPIVLLRRGFYL